MKETILKKGIKKRLFSVVLALAMVVALMPMNRLTVFAEENPYTFKVASATTWDESCSAAETLAEANAVAGACITIDATGYEAIYSLVGGPSSWNLSQGWVNDTVYTTAAIPSGYKVNDITCTTAVVVGTTYPKIIISLAELPPAPALAGTVAITGTAKYGQTLTADTSGITTENPGTLSYQWKRNGSAISGATTSTYALVEADINTTITVEVSSSDTTGTLTSDGVGPVEKLDGPAAPNVTGVACTTAANNDGKITGTTAAMEYSTSSSFTSATACSASETTDLANGTYYVRVKETATTKAGAAKTVTVGAYTPHIHSYGPWHVTKLATATTPGEKERTCECGDKETVATEYEKATDDPTVDPNAGIIENTTDASKNGCGADVELTKAEIIEKFNLTAAELSKVENGVDIAVNLEVEAVDSKNIPSADKDKAEKKLASDEKIGQYLDINLFKIIGADKSKVTQLNGKIKIQITIPSDVKKAGTDYFIIRVHDGVATKLDLTHVSGDTYTFETDQFSTYALGYKTDENGKDVTAPKTGDNNNAYVWMLLMIAGFGVMGYAFFLKRKEEN